MRLTAPTATTTVTRLRVVGERTDDPISMYLADIYTIAVNLAGLPGISVPCGFADGLPVGLQLIGNHFAEARILNVAHRYQLASEPADQRWVGPGPRGHIGYLKRGRVC